MFNKVLAATARPLECDESVLTAGRIALDDNAKLLILHVLESESSIYRNYVKHYRTGEKIVGDKAYQEVVKEEIYKNCSADLAPFDNLEIRTTLGLPWVEIVKWAREESVNLIVLGAHTGKTDRDDRDAIGGSVGSTADGVIRHERCPVMIVGHPIPKSRVAFEKVMVGIDFSPSCISAFQFAVDLAQKRGSKLYLFHMLPTPPQPKYSQTQYKAEVHRIRQRLEEEYLIEIPETIEAEIDTWGGVYPDIEILKSAQQNDVGLIVMGSHTKIKGHMEESRWYVGSAVERVSARSACPVVVITDPKVVEKLH
ncbi:MAG: universal stress protein [Desulfobacterales bacterium]|jgi:nucleotide-binding universal stress UspA family protein